MKKVRILANFVVGNALDEELLLEAMEAAIKDALNEAKDDEWMRVNWGDLVHLVDVNTMGGWNE